MSSVEIGTVKAMLTGVDEFLSILPTIIVQWVKFCVRDMHVSLLSIVRTGTGKAINYIYMCTLNCMTSIGLVQPMVWQCNLIHLLSLVRRMWYLI